MIVPSHRLRDQRGFTLVEVTVAALILVVGILGVLTMLDGANRATMRTKAREGGTNLAREAIEATRAVPYPDLTGPDIVDQLEAQPGLADASPAAGWNLKRRNITYTLTATVCSVDDGTITTDGFGNHTGGFYCSDSTTQGTTDPNPDDYKRVTIDVTWKDGTQTRNVRQEAVINNPGSAFSPAIRTLVPNPNSLTITSPLSSVAFVATTSSRPQEVKWFLDNIEMGNATGSQTTWNFTWALPTSVVDGTYLVGAEAYDIYGQAGASKVLTMVLNRYAPAAPTGFAGGANPLWGTNFTEFEWFPNPERDIAGYRVYRMVGTAPATTDQLACQTSADDADPTSCGWPSAPAGDQRYYVVATAPSRSGPGLEESARPTAAGTLLVTANQRPDPPTNVREDLAADDGGAVTIKWNQGADADGSIRYYRIYRDDNTTYTVRVARTGSGGQDSWTDRDSAAGLHRYWVTAVDDKLAESDFAPPGGFLP